MAYLKSDSWSGETSPEWDLLFFALKGSAAAPSQVSVRSVDRYKFLKLNQTY